MEERETHLRILARYIHKRSTEDGNCINAIYYLAQKKI